MLEMLHEPESSEKLVLTFRKSKGLVAQLAVHCFNIALLIQAIRTAYARITTGYHEGLCCKFNIYSDDPAFAPLPDQSENAHALS